MAEKRIGDGSDSRYATNPGTYQPPKNRIVHITETVNMFTYSAMKNSANLSAEYSV